MPPLWTALVVTHNSEADLPGLLQSLDRFADPAPEVVVVDSGSANGPPAVTREGMRVESLDTNAGFGAANNRGLALVETPVTVLVNPDVVVRDAGLETLARRAHGRDALLVPRLLESDGRVQRSAHPLPGTVGAAAAAPFPPALLPPGVRMRMEPFRSDRARTVGWAIAACVAAPTGLLRRLGPFDARDFLFFEDMDLCLRARDQGVPTELHPDVQVVHAGGRSVRSRYPAEPYELLATRRREVVGARRGRRALMLDDLAQILTFASRVAGRIALARDSSRQRAQLAALWRSRHWST